MVVIHRAHGYRFVIYTDDHEPAHVHVIGSGEGAFTLRTPDGKPVLIFKRGIKNADMRRLIAELTERRDEFLRKWELIHGPIG